MKRGPIVIAGTVAGLVAVLEFHTTPAKLTLAGGAALPPSATGRTGAGQPGSGAGGAGAGGAGAGGGPGQHTATGPEVNYNFGVLSVKVTVSGGKLRKIDIAYLDDGGNPRSQYIDQQSIPILEQQALQAQSASIQGVSGASYTSAGFADSLQAALHRLGM